MIDRLSECSLCGGPVAPDPCWMDGAPYLCDSCALTALRQSRQGAMLRAKAGHPWADLGDVPDFWAPPDTVDGLSDLERSVGALRRRY